MAMMFPSLLGIDESSMEATPLFEATIPERSRESMMDVRQCALRILPTSGFQSLRTAQLETLTRKIVDRHRRCQQGNQPSQQRLASRYFPRGKSV
mmetsp:Transcript_18899/g.40606  ORF Transcript_18899/g.40606 Transcript_18899/m.40606 type:complete len:95 (+) Transcript_18899:119-403(+)